MKILRGKEKDIAEKVIKLMLEKSLRCGDGTGHIPSHSINCNCDEIDRQIKELKKRLTK
jgi:hypothetical protein